MVSIVDGEQRNVPADDGHGERQQRARGRYLATAVEMARSGAGLAQPGDHLGALIRPGDLANRVGVSRTALYKAWPSRSDMWAALVDYLNYTGDFSRDDSSLPWAPPPATLDPIDLTAPEWRDTIRAQVDGTFQQTRDDPFWIVRAATLAYPEPAAVARFRRSVEAHRLATLARRIDIGLRRGHRTFPGPYRLEHWAEAAWAMLDGLITTAHWHPALGDETVVRDDGLGPRAWSLAGWAYRCVLYECTVDSGTPTVVVEGDDTDAGVPDPPEWTRTQRAALAAGVEALIDAISSEHRDAALAILPHITIDRVARSAGVTRRAVYDVWPDRDQLLLDLLDELLTSEHGQWVRLTEAAWGATTSPAADPAAFAAGIAWYGKDDLALDLAISAYLPQSRQPDVRHLLSEHHHRKVAHVARALSRLEPGPGPATPTQLAELIIALAGGLRRVRRVHGIRGWSGDIATSFAWTAAALCAHRG